MRRSLLLIGKVLQHLVNGTKFSETALQPLNSFLEQNEGKITKYFAALLEHPPEKAAAPATLPQLDTSLDFITRSDSFFDQDLPQCSKEPRRAPRA